MAVLSPKSQAIISKSKKENVITINRFSVFKFSKDISDSDKAAELYEAVPDLKNIGEINKDKIVFVSCDEDFNTENLFKFFSSWKSQPKLLSLYTKFFLSKKKNKETNASLTEFLMLFDSFLKLNKANFIVIESSMKTSPKDKGKEKKPEKENKINAPMRIEIFNASGRQSLAMKVSKYMRNKGFDVLTISSYAKYQEKSMIFAYGDTSTAVQAKSALGLIESEIFRQPENKSVSEAAVILGADFDESILEKKK